MADTAAIDPVVLVGLLLGVLSLVSRTIERMVMRWVPHPVTASRGGRTRGRVTRNERLARRGRRGRHRVARCGDSSWGFARSLLTCGRRLAAADAIISLME